MPHPLRSLETLVMSALGIAVMWAGSTACGFAPTSPSVETGCNATASILTCPGLIISVATDAPITVTVGNTPTTVTNYSSFPLVGIDTGLVNIAGTAAGATFTVTVITRGTSTASAVAGSLVNTTGPATTVGQCWVTYTAPPAPTPAPWGFTFRLSSPTATRC